MYWLDKEAAQGGAQRIPESTLHLVDLLGGWPGALIAQQQFRHKTVKRSFQFAFWCSVLANVAIMAWLVRSRSEEHTSELQSIMRISYAVFCLKKKNKYNK